MKRQPFVHFYNNEVSVPLKKRKLLKEFIREIFQKEGRKILQLSIIFCSDAYLLKINQQFLQHNYYTDIITFNLSETDIIDGEIYISIDRVKDNANAEYIPMENELHRVIFHGILHLCGYDDMIDTDKLLMIEKENKYLKKFKKFHMKPK